MTHPDATPRELRNAILLVWSSPLVRLFVKVIMPGIHVQAKLVCHLVAYEIAAFAVNGRWLSTYDLVGYARLWLYRHQQSFGWEKRVRLSRLAADLAYQVIDVHDLASPQQRISELFTQDMQINFTSPRASLIYTYCVNAVRPHR